MGGTMLRSLAVLTTVVLTLTLAGSAAAQEEAPDPAPSAPEASDEATTMVQPPPMAGWREWDVHRQATRNRINSAIVNADNAKAKKKAGAYRSLVGVLDDELQWLSNHAPEDCIVADVESWSAAVEELQASGTDAAALAKKGNRKGLKQAAKRRQAAWTQLDSLAFTSPSEACSGVEPAEELPVLAGKWIAQPVYIEPGGAVDKAKRNLTIGADGKMLLQVPGHNACRDGSRGPVALIVRANGEVIDDGRTGFSWLTERVDCKRKGGKQKLAGPGAEPTMLVHDAGSDVLLMDGSGECYWRVDGGSKKDCQAYWRGTPPQPEAITGPAEAGESTEAEAAAAPDEDAG